VATAGRVAIAAPISLS